ncbi:MAG: endonuclease/exonuclease/phosphatase family protein [Pirellulaceae bacterium]
MQFRLTTYNIHKAIGGVDRRYDPDRVVQAIEHCKPDILFLQEVDDGVPRSRHHCQVDVLADALGLPHRAYQRNVTLKVGFYGNAILSRFPLSDVQHLDLTVPMKKRRRALAAHCRLDVDGHQRTVLLMNVHLGLAGYERKIQLRRLLSWELVRRTHKETAAILAGDFNDVWGNLGKGILDVDGFVSAGGPQRTFPAFMPMRPLDRVYYRGGVTIDHGFASRTKIARQASDHLPLVADCVLTPRSE